jgi:hypothetical protein
VDDVGKMELLPADSGEQQGAFLQQLLQYHFTSAQAFSLQ